MPELKITILMENHAAKGLQAEHGLAIWLEYGKHKILFDTGQTRALCDNAKALGINLAEAGEIILSHGHYDHTGGLTAVLRQVNRPRIWAHPAALRPKYSANHGPCRYIGMSPENLNSLHTLADFVPVEEPTEIVPGVWATGPIPRITTYEDTGGKFFLDDGCRVPDPMDDDQALFAATASGLVVILGCAHAGVINTLLYIQKLRPNTPIVRLIGGMHLKNASSERLEKTITELRNFKIENLEPLHCTGDGASNRIKQDC
jgi:7,8-dihydropterin-6-yl-methyl-4-(beta-D-ribofuranosyl)aminobenzene 5'-phosphate synthase